ncbi:MULTISPECIES: hypothetical protein [Morganella]|uniref:hypothetical protein n=1 Tax=Morganella TaxID=581 RepID=UPI00339BF94D
MSETPKKTEESKPQPAPQPKPIKPAPRERNLRTDYTFVTDSADNINQRNK